MGFPTFYWYPVSDGPLTKVDLGEGMSDLAEDPLVDAVDARAGDGLHSTTVYGANGLLVRITLERFGSTGNGASDIERKLRSMEAHLHGGGVCGFSRDSAKAFGLGFEGAIYGTTFLTGAGPNPASSWSSGALTAGDEIVIESVPPDLRREYTTCATDTIFSDVQVTTTDALRYTYNDPSIVRYRWFFPVLRLLPEYRNRTIVAHDHRRNFTLDAVFEYSVAAAGNLFSTTIQKADSLVGVNGLGDATLDSAAGIVSRGDYIPMGARGGV